MYVCFVEFAKDSKRYLFDCSDVWESLACGMTVRCATQHGVSIGEVVSYPTELKCYAAGGVEAIIESIIGKKKLRKVLSVHSAGLALTDAEKKQIALDWIEKEMLRRR